MKKIFIILAFVASTLAVNGQNFDDELIKINEQTSTTYRNGYSVEISFLSNEISLSYSNRGTYYYKWSEVAGLGITKADRVYLAFTDKTYEYVTPASGVNAQKVLNILDNLIYEITGEQTRILGARVGDADYR
jgi:hypothetical protein